jgi:hypothetical protein
MNTFTAQELADFYQKVADGGEVQIKSDRTLSEWKDCLLVGGGPSTGSQINLWRIKPAKKVINLSVLIDSGVLCVFFDPSTPSSATGKLKEIRDSSYASNNRDSSGRPELSRACKPLMNHKHAWDGGDCPIKGFVVRAWVDKDDFLTVHTSSNSINWSKIMYVEFLEVEDGYVMPYGGEL